MAYPYKKIDEADLAFLRGIVGDRLKAGDEISKDYYHDEMPSYGVFPPDAYAEALSAEEVSAMMSYCNEHNIPVVARGAGTGLTGGATCKYGGLMISLMKMNRIFPVDRKNQTITVQPGALVMDVAAAADAEGFYYAPEPGEMTASIGGNVITNAGGMRAVRYGLTRDFVRCLQVVLPNGRIENFSSNVVKNTTGYDLKNLIIGSEGTLAIVTQVTLKLLPKPNFRCSLVLPFSSLEECADMVPVILQLPFTPTALECLEKELIDMVAKNLGRTLPSIEGEAMLFVMYDGFSQSELDMAVSTCAEAAIGGGALDCFIADTPERQATVWGVRSGILEAMKAESPLQEECDVVVPRAAIAEYVKSAKSIAKGYGLRVEPAGHCGDGNIHTQLLGSPDQTEEEFREKADKCLADLYALCRQLGGQLSGEHGIGNGRIEALRDFLGDGIIDLYKGIKLAFDPNLILNPGKIFEY